MRQLITYRDFAIAIEPDGNGGLSSRVERSAGDSAPATFDPPLSLEELPQILELLEGRILGRTDAKPPTRDVRQCRDGDATPIDPQALGAGLFDALIVGGVRDAYHRRLAVAAAAGSGLRVRLVLDPKIPPLSALPWELLFDGLRFLGLNPKTPIVRYLKRPVSADPTLKPASRPLRVLLADASGKGDYLDIAGERRRISDLLGQHSEVQIDFASTATFESLRQALRDHAPHVLHFMGHGAFDDGSENGIIVLTDASGASDRVTGQDLAVVLSGCDDLRLVVLNACQGGALPRRRELDVFSGVAPALILHTDLPAVVAMQYPITDEAAVAFGATFYEALVKGDPVEAALAEGRQAIYAHDRLHDTWEWLTPVLYLRVDDGNLFHFDPLEEGPSAALAKRILPFDTLITDVTVDFEGRRFVFDAIDAFITTKDCGYFHIVGDPGIGKTALIAELVRRHGYPHHFNVRSQDDYNSTEAFLGNLCAQLITRYRLRISALPPEATQGSDFLNRLLKEISDGLAEGERLVILVDALDEVVSDGLARANLLNLPERLPPGVFFVLTGRRDRSLSLTVKCPLKKFSLAHDSKDNLEDVHLYLAKSLERPGIGDYLERQDLAEERFVDDLTRRSEGNFMYLYHVLREIAEGAYRDVSLESIPVGLENYYDDHWQRMRELCGADWRNDQLPVLAALTLAKRPVTLMMVGDLTGIDDHVRVLTVLLAWDAFLHSKEDPGGSPRLKLYRLYHETFHEFIQRKDEVGAIDLAGANRKISRALDRFFRRRLKQRREHPVSSVIQTVTADRGSRISGVVQQIKPS